MKRMKRPGVCRISSAHMDILDDEALFDVELSGRLGKLGPTHDIYA